MWKALLGRRREYKSGNEWPVVITLKKFKMVDGEHVGQKGSKEIAYITKTS